MHVVMSTSTCMSPLLVTMTAGLYAIVMKRDCSKYTAQP